MAQNNKTERVRCPQDNFTLPRQRQASVWSGVLNLPHICTHAHTHTKKKYVNTSGKKKTNKTKAGVPVTLGTDQHKERNGLGTDNMSVRLKEEGGGVGG